MKMKFIGVIIIASAITWGMLIIGCALVLKETEWYEEIQNLLYAGVIAHLLFVWVPFGLFFKKDSHE